MPDLRPLQEGLYAADEHGVQRLLASRCDACERTFFPRRQYCGRCASRVLRDIALSQRGALYAFSLIDRKPRIAVIDPPYIQADVEMPEGVHVYTVLDGCRWSDLRIGMPVEMHMATVPAPEGEGQVHAYMFRPVAATTEGARS